MRNCIILGSGRSGTSMVAGMLAGCGYFMGERLYAPREANPKGFFESPEINGINEDLLAGVVARRPALIGRWCFRHRTKRRQRWLARVPVGTEVPASAAVTKRIEAVVSHAPFCFKDPRFCYTLPVWRPALHDAAFLCVFRDPAVTAASILKECRDASYLHSLTMDFDAAVEVWRLMYEHVLQIHSHSGDWLFLHYDQAIGGDGIDRVDRLLDVRVDRGFADKTLRRSRPSGVVPPDAQHVYSELCAQAGCTPGADGLPIMGRES